MKVADAGYVGSHIVMIIILSPQPLFCLFFSDIVLVKSWRLPELIQINICISIVSFH